jgi:hypothetical protein
MLLADFYDVRGLESFGALHDVELYLVPLGKGFKAVALDGREMYENVLALLAFDEAVTLGVIEPFDFTFFPHILLPGTTGPPVFLPPGASTRARYGRFHRPTPLRYAEPAVAVTEANQLCVQGYGLVSHHLLGR